MDVSPLNLYNVLKVLCENTNGGQRNLILTTLDYAKTKKILELIYQSNVGNSNLKYDPGSVASQSTSFSYQLAKILYDPASLTNLPNKEEFFKAIASSIQNDMSSLYRAVHHYEIKIAEKVNPSQTQQEFVKNFPQSPSPSSPSPPPAQWIGPTQASADTLFGAK